MGSCGTPVAPLEGMMVQIVLTAGDVSAEQVSASTTVKVNTLDPLWSARLIETVTAQAHEGARQLGQHLGARQLPPADTFVPLAAVVPAVV